MATNGTDLNLTPAQKRSLAGPVLSSPFDYGQRLFSSFDDGKVFDYGKGSAAEVKRMLAEDGNAKKIQQVLTLPIRSASWEIRPAPGGQAEAKYVQAQLGDRLDKVIHQMTTAVVYRKAFFELAWSLDGGDVVLEDIAWRPPATCEAGFDEKTGRQRGFRQRVVTPAGMITIPAQAMTGPTPGYVTIEPERAFVYTHGSHEEPIEGTSDLDVAWWCWETRQKILFLLFQFLEQQSLPKLIAYGDDQTQANRNADAVADTGASGVIGMQRPGDPSARAVDVLESSGKGAGQFLDAIRYLESQMSASVLAGFTDLTAIAAGTHGSSRGSYALSADQSEFFLASRQAVADEIADTLSQDLFKRLCVYQFGPDCKPPTMEIGPLSKHDKDRALTLLESLLVAPTFNCPPQIVDLLIKSTAGYVGLPVDQVAKMVDENPTQKPEPKGATPPGADPAADPNTDPQADPQAEGQDEAPPDMSGLPPAAQDIMRQVAGLARAADVATELVNGHNEQSGKPTWRGKKRHR